MENSLQEVYNEHFGKLRIAVFNGAIYYLGKDAAQCLEYKDTEQAIRKHVQEQDKFVFNKNQIKNPCGIKVAHNAIWINESGLNALTIKAKVPFAQSFRTWLINPDAEPDIFYRVHAQLISNYVYVLEMDDGTIKIGITRNVSQRIKAIQKENGTQVLRHCNSKVIYEKLAAEIESKCHATFEDKRAHGEYFNITFEEGCAELDKYAGEIDAANIELEKMLIIPQIIRTGSYQSEVKPLKNPKVEDFTPRERVEMLFKLLNFNLPQSLKNKIANQIFIELSPDYSDFWEKLLEKAQAE